jgi:hypothetical protein
MPHKARLTSRASIVVTPVLSIFDLPTLLSIKSRPPRLRKLYLLTIPMKFVQQSQFADPDAAAARRTNIAPL